MSHGTNKRADLATNLAAFIGLFDDFQGSLILSACLIDAIGDFKIDTPIGISKLSLMFAIPIAVWAALSAAYCHRILNTLFQPKKDEDIIVAPETYTALIDASSATIPLKPYSYFQRFALGGDWLCHAAEASSILPLLLALIAGHNDTPSRLIPRPALIGAYIGLFILGAICSYADFRTCCEAVREYNQNPKSAFCFSCVRRETTTTTASFSAV